MTDRITTTEHGRISGSTTGEVVSFRGIPYAASPVGPLRFAPPRKHPGWTGVREAVHAGPAVPQGPSRLERITGRRTPGGNEDGSLTLNVWTPASAVREGARLPVLLWFHGGGFTTGSAGWNWYDAAQLARGGGIVVVTANYRVGPLGYLRLPEIGADNLGMQDQIAVLHWVRDNIASFAGDPETVTVGGQSAGAYSALALALNASTGDLVSRLFLQSGPWGLRPQDPQEAAQSAEEYQRILGIPDGAEPGHALRSLSVERLLSAYGELAVRQARPGNLAPPMYPVLGGPGIPPTWTDAIGNGALTNKAVMIGTTRDEMTAFFAFDPRIQSLTTDDAVSLLGGQWGEEALRAYTRYAAEFPGATPAQVVTALGTETFFRRGALQLAERHAAEGGPAYVYRFDYRLPEDPYRLGAPHTIDIPFLFRTFGSFRGGVIPGHPSEAERALAETFSRSVTEFVASGSPSDWPGYDPAVRSTVRHFG